MGKVCKIFGRIGFRGYTKADLVSEQDGVITLSPSNIIDGKIDYTKCTYISWFKYEESPEIKIFEGDIILVKTASIGKVAIVENLPKPATINPQFVVLKEVSCDNRYLYYLLYSPYTQLKIQKFAVGTAVPTFTQKALANMEIPLPPIEEQREIVRRVEEMFGEIEKIEEGKEKMEVLGRMLKKRVLEEAISGRLVSNEMEPGEKTAEQLLKDILAKKKNDPKKAKVLSPIDEEPWALPEGWKWCRLGEIGDIITGTTPSKDHPEFYGIDVPFFKPTDLEQGQSVTTSSDMLSIVGYKNARHIPTDSVLVTCIGATIGKTGIIRKEGSCNQQINAIIPLAGILPEYIYMSIISAFFQEQIKENAPATTLPILNKTSFSNLLFPLPPISIQKRIVERIEEMFGMLEFDL